jgi:hypothetical protein
MMFNVGLKTLQGRGAKALPSNRVADFMGASILNVDQLASYILNCGIHAYTSEADTVIVSELGSQAS